MLSVPKLAVLGPLSYCLFCCARNVRNSLCKLHEMLIKLDRCTAQGTAYGNTGLIAHPLTFFIL